MNKFLIAIVSASIAGTVGFIAGKKYAEKKTCKSLEETYKAEIEYLTKKNEDTPTAEAVEAVKDTQERIKKAMEQVENDIKATGQTEEEIETVGPDEDMPYIITKEQYLENNNYEQRNLTWHAKSRYLSDDDDPALDLTYEIDDLVGYENLETLEEQGGYVYIRNDYRHQDLEVALEV